MCSVSVGIGLSTCSVNTAACSSAFNLPDRFNRQTHLFFTGFLGGNMDVAVYSAVNYISPAVVVTLSRCHPRDSALLRSTWLCFVAGVMQ